MENVPCGSVELQAPNPKAYLRYRTSELLRSAKIALHDPAKAASTLIQDMFATTLFSLSAAADQAIITLLQEVDAATNDESRDKAWLAYQYKKLDLFKMKPLRKLMELAHDVRCNRGDTFDPRPFGY
eukprot:351208-Chlamydomonas_euryale.AAC.2